MVADVVGRDNVHLLVSYNQVILPPNMRTARAIPEFITPRVTHGVNEEALIRKDKREEHKHTRHKDTRRDFPGKGQVDSPSSSMSNRPPPLGPQNGRPKSQQHQCPFLPPPPGVVHAIPCWETRAGECLDQFRFLFGKGWVTRGENHFHPMWIEFSAFGAYATAQTRTSSAWSRWNVDV